MSLQLSQTLCTFNINTIHLLPAIFHRTLILTCSVRLARHLFWISGPLWRWRPTLWTLEPLQKALARKGCYFCTIRANTMMSVNTFYKSLSFWVQWVEMLHSISSLLFDFIGLETAVNPQSSPLNCLRSRGRWWPWLPERPVLMGCLPNLPLESLQLSLQRAGVCLATFCAFIFPFTVLFLNQLWHCKTVWDCIYAYSGHQRRSPLLHHCLSGIC